MRNKSREGGGLTGDTEVNAEFVDSDRDLERADGRQINGTSALTCAVRVIPATLTEPQAKRRLGSEFIWEKPC